MSCINPISMKLKNKYGDYKNVDVACGHCLNCMIKKQAQIEFLAKREVIDNYQSGRSASFVTLTYDDNHLPKNDLGFITLKRSDVQLFLKRMRRNMEYHNRKQLFKVLYCGEYGDGSHSSSSTGVSTCRPHYHIIFIGLSPSQVKFYTRKLWPHGLCDIGPLGAGGIRYLCKYMTKAIPDKDVKAFREAAQVQNPFFYHSIGFGKEWIIRNLWKIVEDEFTFNLNGKRYLFPKYVCQFVSMHTGVDFHKYVFDYMRKEALPVARSKGIAFKQFDYDESFIKYRYKVAALRSQGKPINDFTLSKKWCRPFGVHDRTFNTGELARVAFNAQVPF